MPWGYFVATDQLALRLMFSGSNIKAIVTEQFSYVVLQNEKKFLAAIIILGYESSFQWDTRIRSIYLCIRMKKAWV